MENIQYDDILALWTCSVGSSDPRREAVFGPIVMSKSKELYANAPENGGGTQ